MGLSSAMATSLTGLSAAETTISVVGNNLSNANTVGFKASRVSFASQFLQTLSLGAGPSDFSGGTNPRQVGLGVMVSGISPDHTQGTLEISSRPTDLAIQGDGFFVVQGTQGERLYTRNGEFQFNSSNELVTTTGNRLLGYGVDEDFEIQRTTLEPITIPLGSEQIAEATETVWLEGSLSPNGDLSTLGTTLQSAILGDGSYSRPTTDPTATTTPYVDITTVTTTVNDIPAPGPGPGSGVEAGDYLYRFVWAQTDTPAQPAYSDGDGLFETSFVNELSVNVPAATPGNISTVDLDTFVPPDADRFKAEPPYNIMRVYRCNPNDPTNPDTYFSVGEVDFTGAAAGDPIQVTDTWTQAEIEVRTEMNTSRLTGAYEYYVTFANADAESRPNPLTAITTPTNSRILLKDLPALPDPLNPDNWNEWRIYRSKSGDTSEFYQIGSIPLTAPANVTFLDYMDDATLETQPTLDLDGPKIRDNTLLVDVISRDGTQYENIFTADTTLVFSAKKGGQTAAVRELEITDSTTISELTNFMEEAMGIQSGSVDPANPIPPGTYPNPNYDPNDPTSQPTLTHDPGVWVDAQSGRLMVLGNTGEGNELDVGLSGVQARLSTGVVENINLPFGETQQAVGESAVTDFLVYDTLGMPVTVRLTATLVNRDNSATTYRWYADSSDNDPASGSEIAVGTGLLTFDGEGNFVSSTSDRVTIDRRHVASSSPLEFNIDFNAVSGLATDRSVINVSQQDGSAPGVLASFIVGEDGVIRGIFSNGLSRDLGQLQLARFNNPQGLENIGENLFGEGINSGLPVLSDPGSNGLGKIVAGSLELSNTDIGKDLIKLILASTMYRSNTRVITTSQEMINELLSIRTG